MFWEPDVFLESNTYYDIFFCFRAAADATGGWMVASPHDRNRFTPKETQHNTEESNF